jgi:tRNA U34 5-carboxymethylaminomethyl modifying enzyme MnmG/GidA
MSRKVGLTSGAYFLDMISLGGKREEMGRSTSLSQSSLSVLIAESDMFRSLR